MAGRAEDNKIRSVAACKLNGNDVVLQREENAGKVVQVFLTPEEFAWKIALQLNAETCLRHQHAEVSLPGDKDTSIPPEHILFRN